MTDSNETPFVRLPVREMRDEPAPQRAAQEGDLPPLPEKRTIRGNSPKGYAPRDMHNYARLALAAAGGGVPQATAEKADEMLLGIHRHLQEALRIPTMPWPDPGAHGHEATARAIHTSYCALRFKVMDAIAELNGARVELTGLLASSPQPEAAMTEQERDILQGLREIMEGKGTEAAQTWNDTAAGAHFKQAHGYGVQPEAAPAVAQVPREALMEARGMLESWTCYVPPYFAQKHGLNDDFAKLDAWIAAAPAVAQVPQDELLSLLQRARLYTNGACVHAERAPFAVFRSDLDAAIAALEKQ